MTISVTIADDHVLMRQALAQLLNEQPDIEVIDECSDGVALLESILKVLPDVIVMDISMPKMSGLVAIDKILAQRPEAKILVLSMHNEIEYLQTMRDAGAKGYLLKESSSTELLEAIHKVAKGKQCFPEPDTIGPTPSHYSNPLTALTRREREVFFLVAAGNTSRQIAELLSMSIKTAENHRTNIYKKLNLNSSAELIRMAGKAGLLE